MKNYFKILRYLKPYWYIAILAPIFLIGEVTFLLLIPKTSGQIIDVGITEKNLTKVGYMSLMMLLYTVLSVLFAFLSNFFANWASNEMANDLRIETFKKSLNMSFTNLDEFKIGKVITRVTSDTNMLRWMTRNFLRTIFRAPYLIFGSIFMIITLSPKLAITLIFAIPIIFLSNYFIVKKSYPKYREVQEKLENINTYTQENLENIRVVKAFNRSKFVNDNFDQYIDELQNSTIKANVITSFNSPIFMFVMNMCIVAVLYIGGLDVINQKYDAGNIIAFLGYLGQINMALSMINGLIRMIPRAGASSSRLVELFEVNSELNEIETPIKDVDIKGEIEFRNVTFAYKGQKPILNNVSFKLEAGEKLGILGTTGSGKTSLISLIPRFYDVIEGEVLVDGINVKEYDLHTLRSQISTVMQKALLFAGSIEDNIKFGAMEKDEEEVYFASKNAEAYEFITSFSDGYNTILGERGINLSGGQKQRLSMSRSIITDPKILIFDDSTSAVDMTTERKILKSLNNNLNKSTTIIIAQRIRSVMNADKILVLENGSVTGMGTHNELLHNNKLYQSIYKTQMGGMKVE
ncbi:ABC transporter ATP-binding protein [Mycoplasmatota bacterium]|nr:ABC transporter ATP-binding protein [Mycoplasmatota bacterium]